ncbi:MAG TPA: tetratricopeptide repeat protein [Magnetovibrio sp.]
MARFFGLSIKPLLAVLFVLGAFGVARAQISGGPTGWCTDYEGNNFPCGSPPSDGGGGGGGGGGDYGYGYGGGCATANDAWSDAAIERQNARSFVEIGNENFDKGDYITALDMYYNAWQSDPGNETARYNLGTALEIVGIDAANRGDDMSALLYHERAVDARPDSERIYNSYEESLLYAPRKSCMRCGEALMSDIAYGLGASASIYSYVHQATVNYDNCTRTLDCNDTDGSSFRYLARESCYRTFPGSESGFRACLQQGLEDRGWDFW